MRKTSYILTIGNPCSESWASMRTIERGKFCSKCSKNVVDFTRLTENQIFSFVENSDEKLCGRLNTNQIDRIIEIQKQRKIGSSIYKLLTGLLLFSRFDISKAQTISKNNQSVLQTENFGKDNISSRSISKDNYSVDSLSNFIKGKIFDSESKEAVVGAFIFLKGTNFGTTTDINGIFKFNIPEQVIADQMVFKVNSIGYESSEFIVFKRDLPMSKELIMIPNSSILMGEVCVVKSKRKWWQRKKKAADNIGLWQMGRSK